MHSHNNLTSESQIDHINFSNPNGSKLSLKFKEQLCLKDYPSNLSSHDVIIGELVLPMRNNVSVTADYSSTYSPFSVKKPFWDESGMKDYENETATVLQSLLDDYNSSFLLKGV